MTRLVIVGGGFAGFWSAMSAFRQARVLGKADALNMTMISMDPYFSNRPRFYEDRFEEMRVPLEHYFLPLGIELVVGRVAHIDSDRGSLRILDPKGREEAIPFDGLVLAAGSRLRRPSVPGFEYAFNVDTFDSAVALDRHLRDLSGAHFLSTASRTFVVLGGSFTGLEVVTGLAERLRSCSPPGTPFHLVLTDRSSLVAPEYSIESRNYIAEQLERSGIRFLGAEEPDLIAPDRIAFKSGRSLETRTVVWCGGLEASPLTAEFDGERDGLGRLSVDRFLRVEGQETIFAAGDVARAAVDDRHSSVMSCQHAIPQGKFAGHNVVNALFGEELVPYSQPRYRTCLDLGSRQALLTSGWARVPRLTGQTAKTQKTEILTRWIMPSPEVEEVLKVSKPVVLAENEVF